jgi:HK97 family phage portal protein
MNGVAGLNTIETHKDNLGTGLAARDYGANFFKNGAHLNGYIKYPTRLNQEGFDRVKRGWNANYGGAENSGKTAILDQGSEFVPLNMGPQDAGLLPTQKFNVEDIARITGVPMHMLQSLDKATFNNIEQLSLEFAKYTIRPWVKRWEQEFNRKVFRTDEKMTHRVRLNMDAFMRADTEARAEYYNKAIQNGWMSINEVRKTEKLNPVEGGDKHFIQLNMTTIDAASPEPQKAEEDAV